MLMAPILSEGGGGRLGYNGRQRLPSTDSDDSSSDDNAAVEGPGAHEYKFTEASHSNMVNALIKFRLP